MRRQGREEGRGPGWAGVGAGCGEAGREVGWKAVRPDAARIFEIGPALAAGRQLARRFF